MVPFGDENILEVTLIAVLIFPENEDVDPEKGPVQKERIVFQTWTGKTLIFRGSTKYIT